MSARSTITAGMLQCTRKLDELIAASRRAKNEFVAIEEREETETVQLKDEVKEAVEAPEEQAPTAG